MIALIPARAESKSIPRKNIVECMGHPLIAYTIAACKMSKRIERVIVSTESLDIVNISLRYGAEVPYVRPEKYSTDMSDDSGFLEHFFDKIDVEEVALMRPTTPLRNVSFIDSAIDTWYQMNDKITALRSIHEINETPYKVYKLNRDNICEGFFSEFEGIEDYTNMPRQIFPKTYKANGHIDILKRSNLKKNSVFGNLIYGLVGDSVVDIDQYENLNMVLDELSYGKNSLLKFLDGRHE